MPIKYTPTEINFGTACNGPYDQRSCDQRWGARAPTLRTARPTPGSLLGALLVATVLFLSACNTQPTAEFSAAASKAVSAGGQANEPHYIDPDTTVGAPVIGDPDAEADPPLEIQGQLTEAATPQSADSAELQEAVAGLQKLLDREYQATVNLDPELMLPAYTDGWQFGNHDYTYLVDLHSDGAVVVGHTPAEILSVLEATSPEPGVWLITVLTSELSMEIQTAQGTHLLDTRGQGNLLATYEIHRF